MINRVIDFCVILISSCFGVFDQILDATETRDLWIAAVAFVLFVSVVLLPFRSGHPVGSGGFVGFVSDRVSKARRSKRTDHDD